MNRKGYLVLENGRVFEGNLMGDRVPVAGEAVFNTSMNGYQEIITDPSYAGQILTLTYPQIGNYGFGHYGFEAAKPTLQGLVVREASSLNGHYESIWGFNEFMKEYNVTCLTGVDTRSLTRALRMEGSMGAVITPELDDMEGLQKNAFQGKKLLEDDQLVRRVSVKEPQVLGNGRRKVALWDFGCKRSIIDGLLQHDCRVHQFPAASSAEDIMASRPEALVLSNGPGDPSVCREAVDQLRKLTDKLPIMGICLGHQLLALAMGASTYKLPFGHRGGNHTVRDLDSGQCYITSQNHGYAVNPASLAGTGLAVRFENLNDHSVEGLSHRELPLMSIQFHPEAAPGPHDSAFLFDEFMTMV